MQVVFEAEAVVDQEKEVVAVAVAVRHLRSFRNGGPVVIYEGEVCLIL